MDTLIAYIIKSVIASGILYAWYLLALRNKKFNAYNRFFLLAAVIISLLIPLVNFNWYQITASENIPLGRFLITVTNAPVAKTPAFSFTPGVIIVGCCALVSIGLLMMVLQKIVWIYAIKRKNGSARMNGFNFIETDVKQAPFSFLNNLFWRRGMPINDTNGNKIFKHELAHIKQRHTYDKLFTQIVLCIFWMNPFYWIIQNELDTIHEFIADAASIEEGDTESFALMLLQSHNEGRYLNPSHAFFNHSIKRRLFMITTTNKTPFSYARRVMGLPVAVVLLALFSVTLKAQTDARPGAAKVQKDAAVKTVDHIEVHGQTGIGDTAIVYFKDGTTIKFVLNNPAESAEFKQKYGEILAHQGPGAAGESRQPQAVVNLAHYLPPNPIPENISEITFGDNTIWLTLRDGAKEEYDLRKADEKKSFEKKYGKLKAKEGAVTVSLDN